MTSAMNVFEIDGKSSGSADLPVFGTRPLEEEVRVSDGTARQTAHADAEGTKLSQELDIAGRPGQTEARLTDVQSDVSKGDLLPENVVEWNPTPTASEEARIALEPPSGEVGTSTGEFWVTGDAREGTRVSLDPGYGQVEAKMEEERSPDTKSVNTREGSVAGYEEINPDHEFPHFASLEATGSWMHDFEAGDMVWGKVKSHPWWPGQIYNEAFASPSVRRTKREGNFLVAFFGDSSYGWFDPAELVHFDPHYAEKSRQTNSRNFVKAVEEAVDEASRRQALGLSCYCRNQFNFRPMAVSGFFEVDVAGYEPGGVYSRKQIEKARDGFVPVEVLSFVNRLALMPQNIERWNLDWIKYTAMLFALRKARFEEFDETYAEAFGVQPVRPTRDAQGMLDQRDKVPPRAAPLSGPLVFAEALGERKHSTKSSGKGPKDPSKKNKYLFKRREESPSSTGPKLTETSTVPKQALPTSTETKPTHSIISAPPPTGIAAKESSTPPPRSGNVTPQDQGDVHYINYAQGPAPAQPQAPNVHYISKGQSSSFIIPSLPPVSKQSGGGNNLYAQFDEYVLQKRAPSNAEQQRPPFFTKQEDGILLPSPPAHASNSPAHDVGVHGPFQGFDGRMPKTSEDGGSSSRFTSKGISKASVKSETPGFQKEGTRSAVDSKDRAGVWIPHVFGGCAKPQPVLEKPTVDLPIAGDGGRSLTETSAATNVISPIDVETWPGDFPQTAGVGVVVKKEKIIRKRIREDLGSDGEKKKKKKKKKREPGLDGGAGQSPPQKYPKIAKDGASHRKSAGKSTNFGVVPAAESQEQAGDRVDKKLSSTDIQLPKLDLSSVNVELPQLVSDLTALALDPFYGIDRNAPVIVRHAFLKFRSLVYQKSLAFPPAIEPDATEPRVSKSALAGQLQEPGGWNAQIALEDEVGDQRETASVTKPLKHPLKPTLRKDDPTKGGRKRVPSDRLEEKSAKRMKKLTQLKTLATEKKAGLAPKTEGDQQKEAAAATTTLVKPTKGESTRKPEPPPAPKVASPTYLVMKFPPRTTLPTIASLKVRFARFGPLDLSGSRVYWKTFTCKVLFKHRADAKAAYNHVQNNIIFGQVKVNYSLRDLELPASELPEPGKQHPRASFDDGALFRPGNGGEQRPGILRHPQQSSSVQLKSCLKKPSGEDADGATVVKESPRVKFLLGGEDPSIVGGSNNNGGNGTDGPSSSHAPLDHGSKSLRSVNFMPPSVVVPFSLVSDAPPALSLPPRAPDMHEPPNPANLSSRMSQGGMERRKGGGVDISIQMLSLLLRCSDVVNNVTATLGYAPFHPL